MKIDANDPRWTAYALGEIKDAGERAELERILLESEEIRQMVEEIRRTADLLNDSLKNELPVTLTEAQRDRIESQVTKSRSWFLSRPVWALSGVAALLLLTVSVWVYQLKMNKTDSSGQETLIADLRTEHTVPTPEASGVETYKPKTDKEAAAAESVPAEVADAEIAEESRAVSARNNAARASGSDKLVSKGKTPNVELAPTSVTVQGAPVESEDASRENESVKAPVLAAEKRPESKLPLPAAKIPDVLALVQAAKSTGKDTSISGFVADESGSVLPGATLKLTDVDSGASDTALTNDTGRYEFPSLNPGEYRLTAGLDGFQKETYTNIQLAEASKRRLDFKLPVAGLELEVKVSIDAADILLESNPSVDMVMPEKPLKAELAVNRNTNILNVTQGVDASSAGINPDQMNVQRDGVTVNDARYASGLASPVHLNPDEVGKTQIVLAPVDAEQARGRGRFPAPPPPKPVPPRWPRERRIPPVPGEKFNTESYENIVDNPFMETAQNPLSTFSIDVDTASYSNIRRFLESDSLPPKDAVRIEELVNYFDYDYKGPDGKDPFAARFEMTEAPWNTEHKLLRIGLKALDVDPKERPATNLVFLIDVSGSMGDRNKLPLVKDSLHALVDQLTKSDHVVIVTYAGSTRVALPSTPGDRKWEIHRAIDYLRSGGSTNGASGIQLAYETAQKNFIRGGANRIILATDGDFNVGVTSHGDLTRLIEEKAESGVFLSALGYGMGNYKDDTLELLADKGRGNYAYIDTIQEAEKVLVQKINATLISVAKDVKIQVEFNPGRVGAYRLIGYENRVMPKEDFNDDTKKAGVIGAGHTVTALYEIVPTGKPIPASGVDPLKYQKPLEKTTAASSDELATVKVRYKEPEGANNQIAALRAELEKLLSTYTSNHPEVVRVTRELEDLQKRLKGSEGEESRLLQFTVKDSDRKFGKASKDFKFAASVAAFGMVLRDSPYKGNATLEDALDWAKEGEGPDRHGYRADFIRLIHRAISIKK
jgi:Ca-activated chloride channel family protein